MIRNVFQVTQRLGHQVGNIRLVHGALERFLQNPNNENVRRKLGVLRLEME